MNRLTLPRIVRVSLTGFAPIFENPVTLDLPEGPFLVLGGNAMGKTTTLMATIYAIAGGLDKSMGEDVEFRWGAANFRDRLSPTQNTEIEVEILLGSTSISVRRGTDSDAILGVRVGTEWHHDTSDAGRIYEQSVVEAGGYQDFADFRFLVHRLMYLPENRQSLVWDHKAQIRTLMLICGDAREEVRFRKLNKQLREIDTEKRHLHVAITNLEKRIEHLTPAAKNRQKDEATATTAASVFLRVGQLREELIGIATQRKEIVGQTRHIRAELLKTNAELERLHLQLAEAEDAVVLTTLRKAETASSGIGLQKLLVYHLCPYCAQHTDALASRANDALADGNCPICQQRYTAPAGAGNVRNLRARVAKVELAREDAERKQIELDGQLEGLGQQEIQLKVELEDIGAQLPPIPPMEDLRFDLGNLRSLRKNLAIYENRYAELEAQWERAKNRVDASFSAFTQASAARLRTLRQGASNYAHEFLGQECEFVSVPAPEYSELGELSFLVPKFADIERPSARSCSESERFFLDIGFRMAVLELGGNLTNSTATFVCETPENALDLAYTDNVARMFHRFIKSGFSLLLTANIQAGGVAQPLLATYTQSTRKRRVLDLLAEGFASSVQMQKMKEFRAQMRKILGA
jgi:predicted  nucleic acid-binding Zn-ribbon protein